MTPTRRPLLPDTILGRTIALATGMIVLLTVINLAIIFLRSPPRDLPFSSYELARMIEGKPIAKQVTGVTVQEAAKPIAPASLTDRLIGEAIAAKLGVPASQVQFRSVGLQSRATRQFDSRVAVEHALYPKADFNPIIFSGFEVQARLRDGTLRALTRSSPEPGLNWQRDTAFWLLGAFILVLPIAWWFARAMSGPIKAYASAANRVGREPGPVPVKPEGPAEIRMAAHALIDMQNRLHRYMTERTSMVGAIAHDLRSPLARLTFHLAALPPDVRQRAESEIEEMEQMIAATLEFVQHEARPRMSERIDLTLLVEGVADDQVDLGRSARLVETCPAIVRGDPLLLRRLFANLVGNAVTYGREAQIRIAMTDGQARVTIADKGQGLREEELTRVFEPFYRTEYSRNRQTGGIGLGLAIAQSAAKAHGGEVVLRNGADGGLVAIVSLPLA